MRTPESWEKAEIDNYLKTIDAFVVKQTTRGFGESGHSDRVCCITGRFVAIEVKREGKEPTALQWRRIREVQAAGGMAFWGTAKKVIGEIQVWLQEQRRANGWS